MQVSNCLLLMPASSTAKKGDVKRAVDTQAMALACQSLQLYIPGDACQPAPEYGEELIANFFDDRGDGSVMEDWLNDPTSVEDIIGSSLKITLEHKVPEPTTQTADLSSAAGQTPQGGLFLMSEDKRVEHSRSGIEAGHNIMLVSLYILRQVCMCIDIHLACSITKPCVGKG